MELVGPDCRMAGVEPRSWVSPLLQGSGKRAGDSDWDAARGAREK